jgi:hypothetical protein
MMAALVKIARRLAGRDSIDMPPVHRVRETLDTARKTREAGAAVRDARQAVDAFTASVEAAMRGQRQIHRRVQGHGS